MPVKKLKVKSAKLKAEEPKTKEMAFSVPVYSLAGIAAGSLELPKEVFGKKVNKALLSQAVRVYSTNEKTLLGSTKTRGEVVGSKVKIYSQKGTGRARHGAITAPIFVGGGITFGPKPRKVRLDLPKKIRKAALLHALSDRLSAQKIVGLSSLEKATGKTKEFVLLLSKALKDSKRKNALIVTEAKSDNVLRAIKNIQGVDTLPVNLINAYEILRHDFLLITKGAIDKLSLQKEIKNA